MNIHPLFVHFPIAILFLYSILEILPLSRWSPNLSWNSIKTLLVTVGTLGAFAALGTGSVAEELISDESTKKIMNVHSSFAGATTIIFCVITVAYLIRWFFKKHPQILGGFISRLSFLKSISDFILKRWIIILLALIGLITITITGALGGIIVYGSNSDLFSKFIYNLLLP